MRLIIKGTIHPFIIYYQDDGELKSKSVAMISDGLTHDTVAVYKFQSTLIDYLKDEVNFDSYILQ